MAALVGIYVRDESSKCYSIASVVLCIAMKMIDCKPQTECRDFHWNATSIMEFVKAGRDINISHSFAVCTVLLSIELSCHDYFLIILAIKFFHHHLPFQSRVICLKLVFFFVTKFLLLASLYRRVVTRSVRSLTSAADRQCIGEFGHFSSRGDWRTNRYGTTSEVYYIDA